MNETFALNHERCNIPTTSFEIHKLIMPKKSPSTYHTIPSYTISNLMSTSIWILSINGVVEFLLALCCFLMLFLFPPTPPWWWNPPWNPQGTWLADFMKLPRGANLRGFWHDLRPLDVAKNHSRVDRAGGGVWNLCFLNNFIGVYSWGLWIQVDLRLILVKCFGLKHFFCHY